MYNFVRCRENECEYLSFIVDHEFAIDGDANATIEELVELCDMDAEAANKHDLVGAHKVLAEILIDEIGRKRTNIIMNEIAHRGGLQKMGT